MNLADDRRISYIDIQIYFIEMNWTKIIHFLGVVQKVIKEFYVFIEGIVSDSFVSCQISLLVVYHH